MFYRRLTLRACAWLSTAAVLLSVSVAQTAKRPLNHHDYDGWRTIAGQQLSADGKFLAYSVFPQEGDGEVIIRNLVTGKDQHETVGARPVAEQAAVPEEGPAPPARGVTLAFSSDSRTLVFSTFPAKAETDKARKEKKTPAQMPRDGMVILDLASGKAIRVDRVKRFQMPEKSSGFLAYLRESADSPAAAAAKPEGGDAEDQQGGRGGRGGGAAGGAGRGARPEFGTDLVVRNLADSSERT